MLLLVLRSLAVYAGAAALFLWLAHRFVRPLTSGAALFVALAPFLLTGHATLTGAIYAPLDIVYAAEPFRSLPQAAGLREVRGPILGDVVFLEIPWRKAVRASVKRGELPLWNPDVLAGEPLLAVQQPAVLHPGTWIGFLLPLAQAWTFEMSLRIFLALLSAYLFFRDLGCRGLAAALGASGWAFSNYVVFWLGYPQSAAAAPFPLLLLGLRRLATEPGRRAAGLVIAALLLILASGHPETLLHAVAAAGVYFLFELAQRGRAGRMRALRDAVVAGALTLGLSAVLLLPLLEALPYTVEQTMRELVFAKATKSAPPDLVLDRLRLEASPILLSATLHPHADEAPFGATGYAGALLWPLAAAGLFGRNRARWLFAGLGLLTLIVAVGTPAADALARLPLFDIALNERLIFVTSFSVCALAALGADRILERRGAPAVLATCAASVAGLAWLFIAFEPRMESRGVSPTVARERLLVQIVPLAAGAAVVAVLARRRPAAAAGALLVLFLAERRLETGGLYRTSPSNAFYPPLSVLSAIPRGEPYRFAALGYTFIPNVGALYDLEDVRGYEAMTLQAFWETYPLWCHHQPVWYNRVDDPTRPFLSFLNVRWVLAPREFAPPPGWRVVSEGEGMRLLENPGVLPRAFAPRLLLAETDPGRRIAVLATVPDFAERGVVGAPGATEWIRNGEARVAIAASGTGHLRLDVDAREESVVGTSLTAWPGWRVELDGRRIPTLSYNHAFLAVRVPPGRHRVEFRYAPESVRRGAALSLVSLVTAVVLARRRVSAARPATS